MNRFFFHSLYPVALVFWLALVLPLSAQETMLNHIAGPARGPKVLALPQGDVAVVWQGWLDGQNRIFMRRQAKGEWQPEVIVDSGIAGDQLLPQLARAEDGGLYLCWINRNGPTDSVCYGRYENGHWTYARPFVLDGGLCESLSIAPAAGGSARVAYEARRAGGSTIGVLEFQPGEDRGRLVLQRDSENGSPYGLYPQVFQYAPVGALWYQFQGDHFRLVGADPGAGEPWGEVPVDGLLDSLDASRLPMLFEGPGGELIGLWFDALGGKDRILLSRQNDPGGQPGVVDSRPDWNNSLPAGAISDSGEIAVAWVGETPGGSAIFVKRIGEEQPLRLPCESTHCTFPQVDITPEGNLLVVWQSDENFSGAGNIYFQEIPR